MNKLYILHQNGANSHYRSLKFLCDKMDIDCYYREASVLSLSVKAIIKGNVNLFLKQIVNICFFITLLFTKNKKILLALAPYDKRIIFVYPFIKRHKVYYHTSWPYWDDSFQPYNTSNIVKSIWKTFLENKVLHIFSVTVTAKNSLLENYSILPSSVSVVYHSFSSANFFRTKNYEKQFDYIYVGRLEEQKGISKLVNYFQENQDKSIIFLGKGPLENHIKENSKVHDNIHFDGFIREKKILADYFSKSKYILLPSIKVKDWEELFGMVIIEAMACGCVPVVTNHVGPREIVNDGFGFIFSEDIYFQNIPFHHNDDNLYYKLSRNCIEESKKYSVENISKRWEPIIL